MTDERFRTAADERALAAADALAGAVLESLVHGRIAELARQYAAARRET